MKKQNPNKLAFNKAAVTELNGNQMHLINGGKTPTHGGTTYDDINGPGTIVSGTTGCMCHKVSAIVEAI